MTHATTWHTTPLTPYSHLDHATQPLDQPLLHHCCSTTCHTGLRLLLLLLVLLLVLTLHTSTNSTTSSTTTNNNVCALPPESRQQLVQLCEWRAPQHTTGGIKHSEGTPGGVEVWCVVVCGGACACVVVCGGVCGESEREGREGWVQGWKLCGVVVRHAAQHSSPQHSSPWHRLEQQRGAVRAKSFPLLQASEHQQ